MQVRVVLDVNTATRRLSRRLAYRIFERVARLRRIETRVPARGRFSARFFVRRGDSLFARIDGIRAMNLLRTTQDISEILRAPPHPTTEERPTRRRCVLGLLCISIVLVCTPRFTLGLATVTLRHREHLSVSALCLGGRSAPMFDHQLHHGILRVVAHGTLRACRSISFHDGSRSRISSCSFSLNRLTHSFGGRPPLCGNRRCPSQHPTMRSPSQ